MSISLSHSRLLAIVLVVVAALSLGLTTPAFAQFVQGDLTGNWTIHGLTTANAEQNPPAGNWFQGAITLSSAGVVVAGSVDLSDGSTLAVTAGRLTVGSTGLITGTLNVAGTVLNVRATMTPDKNGVVGVADDAGHFRDHVFALVRQTAAGFSTSDLAGQWLVYGLRTPAVVPATSGEARGALTLNESGALASAALLKTLGGDTVAGIDELTSGGLTVSSDGVVQGSLSGVAGVPTSAAVTYTINAAMEPGRDVIVGVATRDVEAGASGRIFFLAIRSTTDSVPIANLAGTWRSYVDILLEGEGESGAWLEGPLTIRGTDGAVSGTLRNPDGGSVVVSGALTSIADGDLATQLSGDLLLRFNLPGLPSFTVPATFQGGVSPDRDRIVGAVFINVVGTPTQSFTVHGLAVLVRQPVSTVQFSAATYTGREQPGGSTALITVSRAGTAGAVSVEWATTTGGTATAGVDYTAASNTVTFPTGASTATFAIAIADDLEFEGNETVHLVLRHPTNGAVIGPRSTAQLIIVDDEQLVQFAAASATVTVNEGVRSVMLTLTRTGPPATAFTVPVNVDGDTTAVSGTDYPASLNGSVVAFAAGQTTRTFSVPLLDDTEIDGVKTLKLRLGSPVGAPNVSLGSQDTSTITIIDNESGTVKFAQAASSIVEGGKAKIVVTRTGTNLQAGIDITYTVVGGTAIRGDDYTIVDTTGAPILGTGTLSFARGQTTQTITVQTTSDTISELSETVIIQLFNSQNKALLVAPTIHTLTIIDNDTPGVLRFTAPALSVPEPQADREVLLTVTRAGTNLASGVTVDYAVTGGNATGFGADYTLANGTLTFGALEASKTISLMIHPDDVAEGNETIVVTLSNPTGRATLGSPSVMTITIVDDDRAVYFASDGMTLSETTPSATITLLRSGPPAGAFTVPVTIGGSSTAVAGLDYPATFTGVTARFNSGQTSSTVVIPLLNDSVLDGTRNLVLELGTPAPVAPALDAPGIGTRRSMTLVLGDNDTAGQIGFAAAASAVNEGATLRIVVSRTGVNLARDVTVDYGLALTGTPPTAQQGVDFTGGTGTLTFGPGATSAVIEIGALQDGVIGPAKTFTLQLSNPSSGATLISARTFHVVTIRNTTR